MSGLGALAIRLAVIQRAPAPALDLLLLGYIALASAVGWAAVSSDRRGDTWAPWLGDAKLKGILRVLTGRQERKPFRSAFAAQVWYEWNCHRVMMSGFVRAILAVIWIVLMAAAPRDEGPQLFRLRVVLLVMVLITVFGAAGAGLGRLRPTWLDRRRPITFMATRPMSSAGMVAAKLRMMTASLIITWIFAAAGIVMWVSFSGNLRHVMPLWRELLGSEPAWLGIAIAALASAVAPALAWNFATVNLAPGLAGRKWVEDGFVWLALGVATILMSGAIFVARNPALLPTAYALGPWLIAGAALLKGSMAVASFRAAVRRDLLDLTAVRGILGAWFCLAACGVALTMLVASTTGLRVSPLMAAIGIATFVPLARFPLSTLALDWNRHR
jgi:hypothetical protein